MGKERNEEQCEHESRYVFHIRHSTPFPPKPQELIPTLCTTLTGYAICMPKPRTFKNPVVLQRMLYMRCQGWSLKELAFLYRCDHTSVRKACLKNGLPAELPLLPRPVIVFQLPLIDWNGERINRGKSYKEYVAEERERHNNRIIIERIL